MKWKVERAVELAFIPFLIAAGCVYFAWLQFAAITNTDKGENE